MTRATPALTSRLLLGPACEDRTTSVSVVRHRWHHKVDEIAESLRALAALAPLTSPPLRRSTAASTWLTAWVRCICDGCERVDAGGRSALPRGLRPARRRRERAGFELVCVRCARAGCRSAVVG